MGWHATSYSHVPIFAAEGRGARFRDVDGHEYSDFNIADMATFCGHAPEPVVEAVAARISAGHQFLLPTEDAVWVAEELARRWMLPKWQFTLSASQANVEAIRAARAATGRDKVLMFDGKYHGHFDEGLVELRDGRLEPELRGVPADAAGKVRIVQWNDLPAVEEALAMRDVALALLEPVSTNNVGLLVPEDGFHSGLRELTRRAGTLLAHDETHTLVTGPGGLVREWGLEPDIVTLGKSVGGGVPLGAYGMAEEIASVLEGSVGMHGEVATGGTLFGNALSMAAARAALGEVLTGSAYERTAKLGARLADGLEAAAGRAGLPWTIHRLFARSGTTFGPRMPRNAVEATEVQDPLLVRCLRVFLANRGVWEAIPGAGPTVSVPATEEDVDRYVDGFGAWLDEIA